MNEACPHCGNSGSHQARGRWAAIILALLLLIALLAGGGLTMYFLSEVRSARADADREKARAEDANDKVLEALAQSVDALANPEFMEDPRLKDVLVATLANASQQYEEFIATNGDSADMKTRDLISRAYLRIGDYHHLAGDAQEALRAYEKSLEIREQLYGPTIRPDINDNYLARTFNALAIVYNEIGNGQKAAEANARSLALRSALAARDPADPAKQGNLAAMHSNTGNDFLSRGDANGALAEYRTALELFAKAVAISPENYELLHEYGACHNSAGAAYFALGNNDAAQAEYRNSIEIHEKLLETWPASAAFRDELWIAINNLGRLHVREKQFSLAEKVFRQGLALQEELNSEYPNVTGYFRHLGSSHNSLGSLYFSMSKVEESLAEHEQALKIRERLVNENPGNARFLDDLSQTYTYLGLLHKALKHSDEAAEAYAQSIAIQDRLLRGNPGDVDKALGLGGDYANMGWVQWEDQHKSEDAVQSFDAALELLYPILNRAPTNPIVRHNLRSALMGRGNSHESLEHWQQAMDDWMKAIEFDDDGAKRNSMRTNFARVAALHGDYEAAMKEAETVIRHLDKAAPFPNQFDGMNVVCAVSLISIAAGNDESQPENERSDLRESYALTAVGIAKKMHEAGQFKLPDIRRRLETDHDLDNLRDRDDFKELLQSIDEGSNAAGDGGRP